jgi:hypothetical protein
MPPPMASAMARFEMAHTRLALGEVLASRGDDGAAAAEGRSASRPLGELGMQDP